MIRIICSQCKNAYLQSKGDKFICASCGAEMSAELEALVLGIQGYNEGNFPEAADHFMRYIVKSGADPRAIFYKALCDAFQNIDSETDSLSETYKKLLECFKDFSEDDFPEYIALANDEGRKLEKALAEHHVLTLVSADAEKIKAEVSAILSIQKEAREFRISLKDVVNEYNETAARKLSVRFSECYLLGKEIASKVGNLTYGKIIDDISNHTVFTGILSNNIKNLEIYLRCIVMFFKKSHDKFEFLKDEANKFVEISKLLEKGQYNTIKGVEAISEKLLKESYDFLYESYNEHYDEQIDMQKECVVILEAEEDSPVEEAPAEEQTEVVEPVAEEEGNSVAEGSAFPEEPEEADAAEEFVLVLDDEESADGEPVAEAAAEEAVEEIIEEEMSETAEAPEEHEAAKDSSNEEDGSEYAQPEEADVIIEKSEEAEKSEESEEAEGAEEDAEESEKSEVKTLAEVLEEKAAEAEALYDAEEKADDISEEKAEENESEPAPLPERKPRKKKSAKGKILFALIIVLIAAVAGVKYVPGAINEYKYAQATELASAEKYTEAIEIFKDIPEYSDSREQIKECTYKNAEKLEADGKHAEARLAYESLGQYKDCLIRIKTCLYAEATKEFDARNFDKAAKLFEGIKDYGNSAEMIKECSYQKGLELLEREEFESAVDLFASLKKYSDAPEKLKESKYLYVTNNLDKKNKTTVKYLNELTKAKFRNSAELRKNLLGSDAVTNGEIKAFVNYERGDLETALKELDHNRTIYFHVVIKDSSLYGKPLTLKYTTQYGYSQRETVTVSEGSNSAAMLYPATSLGNYTVTFDLISSDGTKLATETISF